MVEVTTELISILDTYVTESAKPLKCAKEPSWYWQLWSMGNVDVTTGTWRAIKTDIMTLNKIKKIRHSFSLELGQEKIDWWIYITYPKHCKSERTLAIGTRICMNTYKFKLPNTANISWQSDLFIGILLTISCSNYRLPNIILTLMISFVTERFRCFCIWTDSLMIWT